MMRNKKISREVGLIYAWLDERISNSEAKGNCAACGKCCDFEKFGHKLFVTTPEIMYFAEKIGASDVIASEPVLSKVEGAKPSEISKKFRGPSPGNPLDFSGQSQMTTGRCPYQVEGPSTSLGTVRKCTVYPYRFSACRIFFCKGNADFQSQLTEEALKKFKVLCEKFKIPYRYVELPAALKDFLTTEGTKIHRDNIEF